MGDVQVPAWVKIFSMLALTVLMSLCFALMPCGTVRRIARSSLESTKSRSQEALKHQFLCTEVSSLVMHRLIDCQALMPGLRSIDEATVLTCCERGVCRSRPEFHVESVMWPWQLEVIDSAGFCLSSSNPGEKCKTCSNTNNLETEETHVKEGLPMHHYLLLIQLE